MIICCGESLIDMIPGAEGTYQPLVGGAIFNTAIALGRLQADVAMVSGISRDLFGQQLVDTLRASHVQTDWLVRSGLSTTLAFVQLNNGHANYTFYDENTAGRSFTSTDLPALPDKAQCLYFGGISLISEPAADAYVALAARYANEKVIVVDPNIRPNFILDEKRYRQRLQELLAMADIIKVSDEDLAWLVPDKQWEAEQLQALDAPANCIFIVTHGAEGAAGYMHNNHNSGRVEICAQKTEVVDTVGAGDTFNAGVLASLAGRNLLTKYAVRNMDLVDLHKAISLGARVAAVTVSRAGANPPWLEEV